MKKLNCILALLLALVMVAGLFACTKPSEARAPTQEQQAETKPAGTKTDEMTEPDPGQTGLTVSPGQMPLVDGPVTLRMAVLCKDEQTDPENSWVYRFIEEKLGIDIELEYFYEATRDESVALMMASGTLPDVMIGMGLSPTELVRYGSEGLLLDIAPYINETNAPNLVAAYQKYPKCLDQLKDTAGHMYSIGSIETDGDVPGPGGFYRMFYNYDLIEAIGYTEIPTTLEGFVQMLRDEKTYGEKNGIDIVPFGGNYARYNPTYLILNALGYNITLDPTFQGGRETDIALRNGRIVLPAYDREAFPKYLETMHTIYEEGLMEQDFYTLDKDTVKAHVAAGTYGVFSEAPGLYCDEEGQRQWWGAIPLTSEYNDTQFWPNTGIGTIGNYLISAETEYPELCVALADFFYADGMRRLPLFGPYSTQTDILLGTSGQYWSEEEGDFTRDDGLDSYADIELWYPYTFYCLIGDYSVDEKGISHIATYDVPGDTIMEKAQHRKSEDCASWSRTYLCGMFNGPVQYATDECSPRFVYFDDATATRVAELKTLIDDYAKQEIAKFIIGERNLSEIDNYFNELQKLGADEYVQYYVDAS